MPDIFSVHQAVHLQLITELKSISPPDAGHHSFRSGKSTSNPLKTHLKALFLTEKLSLYSVIAETKKDFFYVYRLLNTFRGRFILINFQKNGKIFKT